MAPKTWKVLDFRSPKKAFSYLAQNRATIRVHSSSEEGDFESCSYLILHYFQVSVMAIEMKRIKGIDDTPDRLSALPDSLIHHIFSFLEMRDVVKTALLSKRWEFFWLTVPCLDFQDKYNDVVKFCNFVNRALMLWRGTYLHKFTIGFFRNCNSVIPTSDINLWARFATDRKVEELCIRITAGMLWKSNRLSLYIPPQCLFKCSSIRKLSLSGFNLLSGGDVQWNCLNTLELSRCLFSEDVINKIVSSPHLETFSLHCPLTYSNMSIRSCSLKDLSVYYIGNFPRILRALTIWAPNLEALQLSNIPFKNCLLTDVSSLREVNLEFFSNWDPGDGKAICQVLADIQHVATVRVSVGSAKMVEVMKGKHSFSPLLNVKLLKISRGLYQFRELVSLVEIFPKVEMLIVDWKFIGVLFESDAEANILKSNLSQLRTVKITWYKYMPIIFEFVEILLKHAAVIEKIVIEKETSVDVEDMFLAAHKVVTLQRSFPSVELLLCRKLLSKEG